VLLVVEVVSRGSGSEREGRGRKIIEYARAGIAQYWIVDFSAEDTLKVSDPFPVSFDLSVLADYS
jgi:Uma2 family endonuclease